MFAVICRLLTCRQQTKSEHRVVLIHKSEISKDVDVTLTCRACLLTAFCRLSFYTRH